MGQHSELVAWQQANPAFQAPKTILSKTQFLLPGFIDCHIHAAQMPNIGLGLDMELLDWLNAYTFPLESQLADTTIAQHVYEQVVVSLDICKDIALFLEQFVINFLVDNLETNFEQRHYACYLLCDKLQRQFRRSGQGGNTSRTTCFYRQSIVQLLLSIFLCVRVYLSFVLLV